MRKRLVVSLGVVLVVVAALCAPAANAADRGPLSGLRAWGAAVADQPQGDQLARAARTLDARVPRLARRLRSAPLTVRSRELRHSQRALARSLDPVFAELPRARAYFLAMRYQRALETLAERAGLVASPTGLVRAGASGAAQLADSDHDGRLDLVERDDDNDGILDPRDPSDQGWGIPDALQAREDHDLSPGEDGRRAGRRAALHGACISVHHRIPAYATVRAARRALRAATAAGNCRVRIARSLPRVPQGLRAHGVRIRSAVVSGTSLRLALRARRDTALRVELLNDGRRVGQPRRVAARGGRGTALVQLSHAPRHGSDGLRVRVAGQPHSATLAPVRVGPVADAATALGATVAPGEFPALRDEAPASAAAAGDLPVCDRPVNPPSRDQPELDDQDGDGAYDIDEVRPYTYAYTLADGTRQQHEGVRTNPCDANSDHDTVTVGSGRDAVAYALGDGAERQSRTSDPTRIDSDEDGLPDVDELLRWGTKPASGDTDGDGLADRAELTTRTSAPFDPLTTATSPTLRDTDGDSFSDSEEQTNLTNPLIAQVPAFDVRLSPEVSGVQIAIDQATDRGTVTTRMVSDTTGTSSTDQQTDTRVHVDEKVFKEGAEGGCSKGTRETGCSFKVSFAAEQKIGDTITHSSQTSVTRSSQRQVQETYQESLTTRLKENGRLSATFQVSNGSDVALAVSRLTVLANAICLPSTVATGGAGGCLSPRQMTTIATLAPVDNQGAPITVPITLGPGDRKTFQFAATVSTPILQNVMANPGNLVFTPASYELLTPDGTKSYTGMIANALRNQAATLTLDYGDGRVERNVLATNVARAWGAPTQPVALGATTALDVIRRQDQSFGYRLGEGGGIEQLRDRRSLPLAADGRLPGAWAVMGTGQGMEAGTPFAASRMSAGDRLTVAWLADNDADGLFDRQERALGTSDTNPDSDGDGTAGPRPREQGGGTWSSDYFEALVGWSVPFPDEAGRYQVYSSPVACDAEGDGSPDGRLPGPGCPQSAFAPESERRTNPTNRDTNANGVRDGDDARPLDRKPTPVSRGSWRGADLCARPEQHYEGGCLVSTDTTATIMTPSQTLCATGSADPACAGVSGYYRAQMNVGMGGCAGVPAGATQFGSWSVVSGPTRWLDARLSVGEPKDFYAMNTYKLWFQVLGDGEDSRIAYTHALRGNFGKRECSAIVDHVSFEPVSRDQYLRAAYTADKADPDFAAIAVPARSLSRDDRGPVAPDGVQGLRIDQAAAGRDDFTGAVWGPGLDLPAGAWRAEFMLRAADSGSDEHALTPAVSAGKNAPSQEAIAATTGGMPKPTADRKSLVAGHVFHKDLPPSGAGQSVDLLFDQRGASQAVSFPIAVSPKANGAFMLDRVVIDRTPDVLAAAKETTYHGLGFSASRRVDGLFSLAVGWQFRDEGAESLRSWGAGVDRAWVMQSPSVPTSGRYVRWNTLFEPTDPNYGSCDYGTIVNQSPESVTYEWRSSYLFDVYAFSSDYGVRSNAVRGLGDFMTDPRVQTASKMHFGAVLSCPQTLLHQFTLLNRPAQRWRVAGAARDAGAPSARPALRRFAAAGRGAGRVSARVELRIGDDPSGVAAMQLRGPSGTGDWRPPRATIDAGPAALRLRDGAGNVSGWIPLPR